MHAVAVDFCARGASLREKQGTATNTAPFLQRCPYTLNSLSVKWHDQCIQRPSSPFHITPFYTHPPFAFQHFPAHRNFPLRHDATISIGSRQSFLAVFGFALHLPLLACFIPISLTGYKAEDKPCESLYPALL
ncbi:hypothetical protein M011DRAFT_17080 [Sporormia fimetaria CBS 119925]|uniref:Uncharacterized protein n=1 Tax=Sporormia fimetaria CBS 119925 TaxID=1340428 RepID=A0A6A6VND4_9PLEO|nr:hypothetical protein M011DRAFT_17080 [Sporormia fimetaria CBS 119925]